jgi:hypothetical protein
VAAKAESRNEIVVTLPFEFVVGGKTLPARAYRVSRLADDRFEVLILSSYENRISVFVHPVEIESASADKPHLSFERVGEQYFLRRIQQRTTFITFPCPTRSSWRPQRNLATTGLLRDVPEATKSPLVGLTRGISGLSAQSCLCSLLNSFCFASFRDKSLAEPIGSKLNFAAKRNFSRFRYSDLFTV